MKDKPKIKKRACPRWRRAAMFLFVFFFTILNLFQGLSPAKADGIIPHVQDGNWQRSLDTAGNDQLIGLTYSLRTLLWTAGVVLESSQSVLARVVDTSFYQDELGGFSAKREVGGGWNIIKTICNMTLIIILLFIAFGTILRVESYNYKYLLVKLIVVALLVNFSGVIVGVILDFSHIIMGMFSDQIRDITIRIEEDSKILKEYLNNPDLSQVGTVTKELRSNTTRTISRVNVNLILASVLMFILGITVLAVSLFLIVRTVSLWLLFTLSPLALALYVLPHTRIASLKWWDAFLKNAFAGPLLFFFLYLTIFISEELDIPTRVGIQGYDRFIVFSNSGSLLDFLFLVVLLWASIFLSRSLSIAGSMQVVGYFKDLTRGDRSIKVVSKIVDSGGSVLEKTRVGKMLHQWTGAPIQLKSDLKGPADLEGIKRKTDGAIAPATQRAFQPAIKDQTEATRKALESLLNPAAVGRALSIVDSKRQGNTLSQLGGDIKSIGKVAALSAQDPSEFLRTLWKRFEPPVKPTGSFWKDARTLNEEVNKQIEIQEKVRQVSNDLGVRGDKIIQFQAKDQNEKEAQIYKLAWTGGLPDYFNVKLGKAYNQETLSEHIKTTFGEKRGSQVAEKLKMIGETKKDPSLSVVTWNDKKTRYDVTAKPQEVPKIKPKDLRTLPPQSILNKNEKGEYTGFNEAGMFLLKQISNDYMKEIGNMREDTVKAIAQAYKSSQQGLAKELAKGGMASMQGVQKEMARELARQVGKKGVGAIQAETIKAISKAQMHGRFHVEEVQAPNSQISLGQEFLNKIAGRAFASKRIDTGEVKVAKAADAKKEVEVYRQRNKSTDLSEQRWQETKTEDQQTQENKIAGKAFAEHKDPSENIDVKVVKAEGDAEEVSGLKDKQKFLLLGGRKEEE